MNVGITYDLRDDYLRAGYGEEETAEFDREETIASLDGTLRDLGYVTDRIGNVEALIQRLNRGDRWDLVFNIAEGLIGYGREALVPALLDAFRVPYTFSDPMVLSLTLHKGMVKRVIRDLGIPTPDFAVVGAEADIAGVALPFPLFAKPVAEGTGKGIDASSKIKNEADLDEVCRKLLRTFHQPVLVETFLPGREFTVGITGTGADARALGAMEVILNTKAEPDGYGYHNKESFRDTVEYRLVDDPEARRAAETALDSWRGIGCRDGGRVDLRSDDKGVPHFIEVNPLAGLHPEISDLCILAAMVGMSYRELIGAIVTSALSRNGGGGNGECRS